MKVTIDRPKDFKIGDQIYLGNHYTATCQKVGKKGAIFLFDQILNVSLPMNCSHTNIDDDYSSSYLRECLKGFKNDHIFDEVREMMIPFKNGDFIRIPTAEEIFGVDEVTKYDQIELISNKKQWPLMMNIRNRIPISSRIPIIFDSKNEWTWLKNRAIPNRFACISASGILGMRDATYENSIRIVFRLSVNEKGGIKTMSYTKHYLENLVTEYLKEHPEITWEDAMKKICGEDDADEEIE